MDESRSRSVTFLKKEIKTYAALSSFLPKKRMQEDVHVGWKKCF